MQREEQRAGSRRTAQACCIANVCGVGVIEQQLK
jgi:hypothetical protein